MLLFYLLKWILVFYLRKVFHLHMILGLLFSLLLNLSFVRSLQNLLSQTFFKF